MAERAHPEDSGFQEGSIYRENLFKRYAFVNRYTKDKEVLDIPCGVGWGTSLLEAKSKIGIDISSEAIDYAKEHYPNIDFRLGIMSNILLSDNSLDTVVCLEGFEHVEKEIGIRFLSEVSRILKPSGLLVMTCPVLLLGDKHSGNPYHLHEPSLDKLGLYLSTWFDQEYSSIEQGPDGNLLYFVGAKK